MELPTIDSKKTAENIKRLMRLNRLDTFDLAMALKMRSTTSIYAWTQGRIIPSADNLVKLAAVFGVRIDDILVISKDGGLND